MFRALAQSSTEVAKYGGRQCAGLCYKCQLAGHGAARCKTRVQADPGREQPNAVRTQDPQTMRVCRVKQGLPQGFVIRA
jgi:hypothetical protein